MPASEPLASLRTLRFHRHGEPADVLRLENASVPNPGANEVRVQVRACAYPSSEASTGPEVELDKLQPMQDATRQVRALVSSYRADQSEALIGQEAHEDALKQRVSNDDVLHLATHGFLNDAAPMCSRLLMAQTSLTPDEDSFLEAWEWLPLRLRARLVVPAACESGRGKVRAGEGVLGLNL